MFVRHVSDCVFVAAKAGVDRSSTWMTGHTGDNWVLAMSERERVFECGRLPGCGGVTCRAVRSSLASVNILCCMAGNTFLGCAYEHAVDVALSTSDIDVRSCQREGGQVVIEGGRLPGCGGVTGSAVRSILAGVAVIGRVTCITSCGCAFEFHIFMASGAGNGCMLAGQLEDGAIVVEGAGLPTSSCMAGFT